MTGVLTPSEPKPDVSRRRRVPSWRRYALLAAGPLLGLGIAVIAFTNRVDQIDGGNVTVQVGTLGAAQIMVVASAACLSALAVGLCVIPVTRRWLVILIPARAAAVVGVLGTSVLLMWSPWTTTTPLLYQGCETGYTAVERSFLLAGTGGVYRLEAIVATRVGISAPDDGYHPFADGNYAVRGEGDSLHIWYSPFRDEPVSTDSREPDIVAPRLIDAGLRCGIDAPTSPYQDSSETDIAPQLDPEDDTGNPWFRDLP